MNRAWMWIASVVVMCGSVALAEKPSAKPAPEAPAQSVASASGSTPPKVAIQRLNVTGVIEQANITFTLEFDADVQEPNQEVPLIVGQVTLASLDEPKSGYLLRYDAAANTYYMGWRAKGTHHVKASFAARAEPLGKDVRRPQPATDAAAPWHEAAFALPSAKVRQIDVACDRTDLEVQFPDAMRVERRQEKGQLVISAILGPAKPFIVRFKPQVQKMEAKLVFSSQANIITAVSAATLRVDGLFTFDVAQGELSEIRFKIPPNVSVTQVRGLYIQDWSLVEPPATGRAASVPSTAAGGERILRVALSRPQTRLYSLQVQGERTVPAFPSELDVPVIEPLGGLRAGGHLAVGTGSAIQLQVAKTAGLTQIDTQAFPRVALDDKNARPLPGSKVFSYLFAASPYELALRLDNITPTFDASYRQTVTVKDEDFTMDVEITLDVREAPLRDLLIAPPHGFQVASVTGAMVEDYRLEGPREAESRPAQPAPSAPRGEASRIRVQFKQPVMGKTNIVMRLELGRSPLDESQKVEAIRVVGAKAERGFLAIAAEDGLQIDASGLANLREVNVASLEVIPPDARLAYRFRQSDWSLALLARKKPSAIRTESFHLISIGEGRAYGSVAISYYIAGSPVDRLKFVLPETLRNVQFVGRDVRRSEREGTAWTVHLQRRAIGDYNLGLTYDLPYEPGGTIPAGAVQCEGVETQTGYIAVTSHLNLELTPAGKAAPSILEVSREEVPGNYRLLATAPILKTYKYVSTPHMVPLAVKAYDRAEVIPAIVEVVDAVSRLAIREDNQTESVTTVRYKVKNTSSQFLTLQMPPGATVWATRLIERGPDGREAATRLAASMDEKLGLMIPLPRRRNPNDPITVEVEYGQTHGTPGRWETRVALAAPRSVIPATFAHWRVGVPDDYAVRAAGGGSMVSTQAAPRGHDLASVLGDVARSWAWVVTARDNQAAVLIVPAASVLALMVLAWVYRRAVPDALVVLLAALLLAGGIAATRAPAFQRDLSDPHQATSLQFTQVVNLQEQAGLAVNLVSVPAWRQHLTLTTAIAVPAALLGLAVLASFVRRLRRVCFAATLAAMAFGAASISPLVVPMGHVLTWGLPLLLALGWLASRRRPRGVRSAAKPVVAAMLLGLALLAQGCQMDLGAGYVSNDPVIERIEYKLVVEKDSMAVDCRLKVSAPRPAGFAVMDPSAVLLSSAAPQKDVAIELDGGMHRLKIKAPGVYDVRAQFLSPLTPPDSNRVSRFSLSSPLALANTVELTVPEADLEITAVNAFRCRQDQRDGKSVARAILPPGKPIEFQWKPRTRQTSREETKFYSQVTSVVCFDASLVSVIHDLRLQVAQGELKLVRIAVPANTAVTAVDGASIGAWRFDPAAKELEVRFAAPVTGDYSMRVVAQATVTAVPYSFEVRSIGIPEAQRQRTLVGLVNTGEVFIEATGKPQAINVDDFARDAAGLIKMTSAAAPTPAFAYRLDGEPVSVRVSTVSPELRVNETATFNVLDERLVYNGRLDVQIAKAGQFSIQLVVPAAYDIDALTAPQMTHWDESVEGERRVLTAHFAQKTLGAVPLALAMSSPIAQLPDKIVVPRVELAGALRHTGQAILRAERGVRLTVSDRQGVTEVNALELGVREPGALAFKLLKPNASILLQAEVIEPLVNVDMLHVARISEGMVQHQHYLRYRLFHAGVKALTLRLPADALGVTLVGPDIARRQQVEPGLWRIELAKKWFDAPYPLQISYQGRFDRERGEVTIQPIEAVGADQQRGHVVIYTTDRVELRPDTVGPSLQPAEARSVPGRAFGAGDLSDAAFCYANSSANYSLTLRAVRHAAAVQVEADVKSATLRAVVTESGQSINHAHLEMTVGSKRYLQCWLPQGAQLWSLLVNGRAAAPSSKVVSGRNVLLVPLAQTAARNVDVQVDLVYVVPNALSSWSGRRSYVGPRFDLPLKNIQWRLYLPESFNYDDFKGALAPQEGTYERPTVYSYSLGRYEQSVSESSLIRNRKAMEFQKSAQQMAQEGKQYGARELLEQARTFSLSDSALNEDISVDLGNLLRQQAKVGLVGSRDRLRRQTPGASSQPAVAGGELGDQFNQQQAEQVESSLGQADSENLDLISRRMIEVQEAAAGSRVQLLIELPERGKMIEFTRPLLVEPDSPMEVSFDAAPLLSRRLPQGWLWTAGLFAGLAVVLYLGAFAARRFARLREWFSRPKPVAPSDDQPVSASELGLDAPGPASPPAGA